MHKIPALFVQKNGTYFAPEFDPWDEARDARLYAGPHPVIAHPPCARWCRLAGLVEQRWGIKRGEDGGCFASALRSVQNWGGVLEHPAYSDAWPAFGLPRPLREGGWSGSALTGFVCHIEQHRYGHRARKATWLYVYGVREELLPELDWGRTPTSEISHWVSWCGNHGDTHPRLSKKERSATPPEFKTVLVDIVSRVV